MRALALALFLTLLPASVAFAQGGPPLLTDDPDTPGPGYWEINVGATRQSSAGERRVEWPLFDVNYGVGERIQLKVEFPWVRLTAGGESTRGAGNLLAGVKWRFIGQEGRVLAWSIYPQLEFSGTAEAVDRGTAEKEMALLLPTELTVEVGGLEVNSEVGRTFSSARPTEWIFGVSTEGHIQKRVELVAEIHGEKTRGEASRTFTNVGARPTLTPRIALLLAAGNHSYLFTGLQLNLPRKYVFPPRT